jgi:anti-sigma regulatory factor (Ser/Thr protein kinase)
MNPEELSGPVLVEIPADPGALFLVRCLVERLARQLGFLEERVIRLTQAVDEACSNVIRHAYGGRTQERILLSFLVSTQSLEVQVRDFASPPDPSKLTPRDLGEVRPGGLGLHLIRAGADEVHYESVPGQQGCLLRLVLFREGQGGSK